MEDPHLFASAKLTLAISPVKELEQAISPRSERMQIFPLLNDSQVKLKLQWGQLRGEIDKLFPLKCSSPPITMLFPVHKCGFSEDI